MNGQERRVIIDLIVTIILLRVQHVFLGVVFYENDSFRTSTIYVRQSILNNLETLKYMPVIAFPTLLLLKILPSNYNHDKKKVMKVVICIILVGVLDISFYAGKGLSIIRTISNLLVSMR